MCAFGIRGLSVQTVNTCACRCCMIPDSLPYFMIDKKGKFRCCNPGWISWFCITNHTSCFHTLVKNLLIVPLEMPHNKVTYRQVPVKLGNKKSHDSNKKSYMYARSNFFPPFLQHTHLSVARSASCLSTLMLSSCRPLFIDTLDRFAIIRCCC